jgi:UMF1 family MFS transporter
VSRFNFRFPQLMRWEEPKRYRWFNARMIAWALFDLGVTIFSMVVLSRYAGIWVKEQMGGSIPIFNVTVSVSMAIAGILQILLSPISDELGKRRVFVIYFTALLVIGCGLMSKATVLKTALLFLGITNIGYQTALVFYNSMLSDVSDRRHRARVSGIGMGLAYFGSIIGLLIAPRFVEGSNYSKAFAITGVLVFLFALPLFIFVKEKPSLVRLNLAQSLQNSIGSFLITIRRIAKNREMLFFFLGSLLALDVVETVVVNMALYCKEVVGLSVSDIDMFLITSVVFAIVGAIGIGHISDKTNHYRTLLAVFMLWMFTLVLAMFSVQRDLFWITGPLFGLGFGGVRTVGRAYLLEICHPEERGQMFAIYGLVGRGAAVFGPLVWAATLHIFNPVWGERKAYRIAIGAMLLLMVIGFWIISLGKPKNGHHVS